MGASYEKSCGVVFATNELNLSRYLLILKLQNYVTYLHNSVCGSGKVPYKQLHTDLSPYGRLVDAELNKNDRGNIVKS